MAKIRKARAEDLSGRKFERWMDYQPRNGLYLILR